MLDAYLESTIVRILNEWKLTLGALTLLLVVSHPVNAAFLEIDWQNTGDKLLVRDTQTNLEWLDLSLTDGQSLSQVIPQLSSGGSFDGFRVATEVELYQLYGNADFSVAAKNQSASFTDQQGYDALIEFIGMMSPTVTGTPEENGVPINVSIRGFYNGIPISAGQQYPDIVPFSGLTYWTIPFSLSGLERTSPFYESIENGDWNGEASSSSISTFLVRTSAVPLPSAFWLLLSGLIGLLTFRRNS